MNKHKMKVLLEGLESGDLDVIAVKEILKGELENV